MKIQPMLCQIEEAPFDSLDFLFEPKLDGVRIIAQKEKNQVRLYSRYWKLKNLPFFQIVQALKKYQGDFILDGEICALDQKGIPHFQLIQDLVNLENPAEIEKLAAKKKLIYYVFDILKFHHQDLKKQPLLARKKILEKYFPDSQLVKKVPYIMANGKKLFQTSLAKGYEGIIAKKKNSLYLAGRSSEWLKIKGVFSQETVIGGYTAGQGNRLGTLGALLLGLYRNGNLQYIGACGTGYNEKTLKMLWGKLQKIKLKSSLFSPPPRISEKVQWVRPRLVAQVKFLEWTKDQKMRQPVFLGLRDDKKPKECVFEK